MVSSDCWNLSEFRSQSILWRNWLFIDKPLSDIDRKRWCGYLNIPITGIYARDEKMTRHYSPCVIISGHSDGIGTHCVACNLIGEKTSILRFPPPLELLRKNSQIQVIHNVLVVITAFFFSIKGSTKRGVMKRFLITSSRTILSSMNICKRVFWQFELHSRISGKKKHWIFEGSWSEESDEEFISPRKPKRYSNEESKEQREQEDII